MWMHCRGGNNMMMTTVSVDSAAAVTCPFAKDLSSKFVGKVLMSANFFFPSSQDGPMYSPTTTTNSWHHYVGMADPQQQQPSRRRRRREDDEGRMSSPSFSLSPSDRPGPTKLLFFHPNQLCRRSGPSAAAFLLLLLPPSIIII